jgi:hypothetical protein
MTSSSERAFYGSLIAILLLFCAFGLFLGEAGLLNATGQPKEVTAAALALVGGLVTAVVSLFGVLLKHSVDERTAALQAEAEERLKLEAGLRAVGLFATSDGRQTPPMLHAGALYTLASLHQYELTLDLAFGCMDDGTLSPGLASGILNNVLCSTDRRASPCKASVLQRMLHRMNRVVGPHGVAIPSSIFLTPTTFPPAVRRLIPALLGRALISRPLLEWWKDTGTLFGIVGTLCLLWEDENDEDIKEDAGTLLARALRLVPPDTLGLFHPLKEIDLAAIRSGLGSPAARTRQVLQLSTRMDEWLLQNESAPPIDVQSKQP